MSEHYYYLRSDDFATSLQEKRTFQGETYTLNRQKINH